MFKLTEVIFLLMSVICATFFSYHGNYSIALMILMSDLLWILTVRPWKHYKANFDIKINKIALIKLGVGLILFLPIILVVEKLNFKIEIDRSLMLYSAESLSLIFLLMFSVVLAVKGKR